MCKQTSMTIMFLLLFPIQLFAGTTYYMANNPSNVSGWGNGSNTNNGLSKAVPFNTIIYSLKQMIGGDTLIIADGTYSGQENQISPYIKPVPEGSPGAYTIIKAEHTGGVTIDAKGAQVCIYLLGNDTVDGRTSNTASQDYIQIEGIVCKNANRSNIALYFTNHVKLINVGSVDPAPGNYSGISINYSKYVLLEGGYVWGGGRYKISTYHSDHTILRNCVARFDRGNAMNNPIGTITMYSSTNMEVQNCIAIDSDNRIYWENVNETLGAFNAPSTSATSSSGPIHFTNVISVNNKMRFGSLEWNAYPTDTYFKNCVGWNIETTGSDDFIHSQGNLQVNKCTFGNVSTQSGSVTFAYVNGWKTGNYQLYKNNIFHNFTNGGLFYDIEKATNNLVYGFTGNIDVHATISKNAIGSNPLTNGLSYLVRTEKGSPLDTAGDNGTYIGANMLKMYGKPGTLWGETGYNQLQDGTNGSDNIDLWPFPNEALIRSKFKSYSYDGGKGVLSGDRGFSVDGQTLSNYIWGYLGSTVPPFNVKSTAGNNAITVSWDAPAPASLSTITGFKIYDVTGGGKTLKATVSGNATYQTVIGGLTDGQLYDFTVTAVDSIKGESGHYSKASGTPYLFSISKPSIKFYVNKKNNKKFIIEGTSPSSKNIEVLVNGTSFSPKALTTSDSNGYWSITTDLTTVPALIGRTITITAKYGGTISQGVQGTYDITEPMTPSLLNIGVK